MGKELEVKILNVDVASIRTLLESINCKFHFDRVQRLVTYDFNPINSTFIQLIYEMKNGSDKTNPVLQSRIRRFLHNLFDIVSDNDKKTIVEELASNFKIYNISDLFQSNFDLFNSSVFMDIVEKYSINPNKWIRVRTDGVITTITTKHIERDITPSINEYNIDDVDETEIQINDFDKGIELMQQLGYFFRNYQEKRRIMYVSEDGLEIDIDFWPMIPPYLEIEGKNEEAIYNMVNNLGFSKSDIKIANTDDIYKIYGLDIYSFPELKFDKSELGGTK